MVSIAQLWPAVLLAAVLIFAASSLIHMVFKWHNSEYRPFADEDAVRAALGAASRGPGQYVVPHVVDMKQMQDPAIQRKFADGPVAFVTVRSNGPIDMRTPLVLWFAYTLVVSLIAGYVATKSVGGSASSLQVIRITSLVPFLTYAGGSIQQGIWMGKPWSSVAKEVLDAAIYAGITASTFACLWPR